MKVLPLLGALTLGLAPTGPALAEFTRTENYRLGEMAAICGMYHQDAYGLPVVEQWARLSRDHEADILRLTRGMRRAWLRDDDSKGKEIRKDFLACYDRIIRVLD